jgi:hypothetical protein
MADETKQTVPQTATQTTPETPESKIAALEAEKGKLAQELENTRKGLATAHQDLTKKDKLLKSIDYQPAITELNNKISMLTAFIAENQGKTAGDFETQVKERPADLLAKFQRLEAETKAKQALTQAQAKVDEYKDKVEALGLTESDDDYLEIQDLVERGRFVLADKRIAKIQTKKPETKTETPKESEEERISRLAEEKARKYLEDNGLLKKEGASPSSSSGGLKSIEEAYNRGEVTTEQYRKARKEQGLN